MTKKRRWTEESRVRCFLAIGILLSLAAYLLFVGMDSALGLTCSTLLACAGLGTSFYGLWVWNTHQKAQWARSQTGQSTTN